MNRSEEKVSNLYCEDMKPRSSSLPLTVYDGILVQVFNVERQIAGQSININAYKSEQNESKVQREEKNCPIPLNMHQRISQNGELGVDTEAEAEVEEEQKELVVEAVSLTTNYSQVQQVSGARVNNNNGFGKQINSHLELSHRRIECLSNCEDLPQVVAHSASVSSTSNSSSSLTSNSCQIYIELGNKCGKCQNHEIDISKKGHARDCPFKKCNCLKCRLLDARSDILQVISGKETKLKGTKKDPNCGFCQNHGVKILRKGHVRSCGFGQERHFKLDNCFDCEVHYIRNEVNRLQIKMRRAMKEDRTLSEEQRKTAREAITRDEVEKVCNMARLARKKREHILMQQAGETASSSPSSAASVASASAPHTNSLQQHNQISGQHSTSSAYSSPSSSNMPTIIVQPKLEHLNASVATSTTRHHHHNHHSHQLSQLARQTGVWRPWSQHQVAAARAAQQHRQQQQQHQQQQQQQQQQIIGTGVIPSPPVSAPGQPPAQQVEAALQQLLARQQMATFQSLMLQLSPFFAAQQQQQQRHHQQQQMAAPRLAAAPDTAVASNLVFRLGEERQEEEEEEEGEAEAEE